MNKSFLNEIKNRNKTVDEYADNDHPGGEGPGAFCADAHILVPFLKPLFPGLSP